MTEREIFDAALQLPDDESRSAYLQQACGSDSKLREHLEGLLRAQQLVGSFLQSCAPAQIAKTIDMPAELPMAASRGTQIGPYKLLQQIGEGGMGTVYMAEQTQPVQRKVALKLIKPGMDSRQVIARFEAERQALALMDHPHIARVLDAGTTSSGLPFFVMELVKGVPITKYCDEHHLTPQQRLELFIPVCQAVQHAHQKGIIHRDLKPSNVLVTLYDGRPVPKVIDFGIAKATGQKLTERTMYTEFGAIVGTLEYMSPEQAEPNQLDVDTRSDIYSLGVLLYELLTGTTPFEKKRLKDAALMEMLRIIREDEPPKPSTRLSTTDELASISANRGLEPKKLSDQVRGELDWIVMKALEKDRNRRYETANGFALDIQRYLADEAVQACPPSAAYRFRKFVRRNRAGLVTAGLLSMALLVAMSAIGWTIRDRSAVAKEVAQQNAARRTKLEGRISEALNESQAAYERDNLPQAIAAVNHAEKLLASDDAGAPAIRERVRHWRGELDVLRRLEDLAFLFTREQSAEVNAAYGRIFQELGIDVDELPIAEAGRRIRSHVTWQRLTEALDQWSATRHSQAFFEKARTDGSQSAAYEAAERVFAGKRRLLKVARAADPDELRSQVRLAVEAWDVNTADRLADSPEVSRLPASTLRQLAMLVFYGANESHRESGFRLLENARRQRPGDFRLSYVSALYCEQMEPPRLAEAAHYWSVALAIRPDDARVQAGLAYVYDRQRKVDDAIASYRRAIELDPTYSWAHRNGGFSLLNVGMLDEGVVCCRKAIELDPTIAVAHNNLGVALERQRKPDETIACYRKAVQLDPKIALYHSNLGSTLADQGKPDEGIACLRRAIELDPRFVTAHTNLGEVLINQGKLDEGIACYRQAIELDPKSAEPHSRLGFALVNRGEPDEAIASYQKAVALDPKSAQFRCDLGLALANHGKPAEAADWFREAIELDPKLASAHENLGAVLLTLGNPAEAIACLRQAIAVDPKSASAHAGLGNALRDQNRAEQAIACYRQAILLDPKQAQVHNNLGVALKDQGNRDEAVSCFRRAVEVDPKFAVAHYNLGAALNSLGKTGEAIACFRRAIDLDQKLTQVHSDLGAALKDQGNQAEAVAWYRQAVELESTSAPARNNLGVALKDLGQPDEAITCFRQAIELDPKYAPAHGNLGTALAERGEIDEAIACQRNVIELDPKSAVGHARLAAALNDKGELDEAVACYRRAIELSPAIWGEFVEKFQAGGRNAESESIPRQLLTIFQKLARTNPSSSSLIHHLAQLIVSAGLVPETLAVWEKLVDESSSDDDYRLRLGHELWQLADQSSTAGRPDEAEKTFRRALEVFEKLAADFPSKPFYRVEHGYAHWKLAWLMNSQSRHQGAEESFRRALAVYQQVAADYPENQSWRLRVAQSWKAIGDVLVRQRRWDDAAAAFTSALELASENADFWNGRAFMHFNQQHWNEAISDFSKAIELAPEVHTNWFHRGHCYLNLAQWDKAAADFGTIVARWPAGGEGWYRRASALAQLNQPDKALADLRQALAKGFHTVELIRNDSRLEPLRDRDDFRELLKEFERAEKSPGEQRLPDPEPNLVAAPQNRDDEAITGFLAAIERDPHNSRGFFEIRNFISDRADAANRSALIERVDCELPDSHCRPDWNAIRGNWQDALAGMLQRIESKPEDHFSWYQTAFLYARLGDVAAYRRHCREMLSRFGKTRDPAICERVAKACSILTGTPQELQFPRQLASRAVDLAPQHEFVAYYELAQSLAEYRAEDFSRACVSIDRCLAHEKGMALYGIAMARLLQAMSRFQQGDAEEARQLFVKAIRYCDGLPQLSKGQLLYWDWHDGIAVDLLRREAEELFMNGVPSKQRSELTDENQLNFQGLNKIGR